MRNKEIIYLSFFWPGEKGSDYQLRILDPTKLPHFSDYKMPPAPTNLGGKWGVHLIVRKWLTWLAGGVAGPAVEWGFFPYFPPLKPRCVIV